MAIEIGDAIWRIGADDSRLNHALRNSSRAIGAMFAAAGAAVASFAATSVKKFAETGDMLDKMSQRTGFSVRALSEYGHVLEQSGSNLDTFEKANKKLSQSIYEAGRGSKTYQEALQQLGIRYRDIIDLSPEEQFDKVAMALADVENHSTKAALAAFLFGRAGTDLLPMLKLGSTGIADLREEAGLLGIAMNQSSTDSAFKLTDAINRMRRAFTGLQLQVGEALAPTIHWLADTITEAMISFRLWRAENEDLFSTITKVATGVALVVGGLAPFLILAPGVAAVVGGLSTAIGGLSLPLVAIGAALAAGTYLLYQYFHAWGGWPKLWSYITDVLNNARGWMADNWEQLARIMDSGKNVMLSMLKILWTGIQAAFSVITVAFNNGMRLIGGFFSDLPNLAWDGSKNTLDNLEVLAAGVAEYLDRAADAADWFLGKWDAFWKGVEGITDSAVFKVGELLFMLAKGIYDYLPALQALKAGLGLETFGGAFSGAPQTQLATGGTIAGSGWAVVGERGPELVHLPRGASVYDAEQSRAVGAGPTVNVNVTGMFNLEDPAIARRIGQVIAREAHTGLQAVGVRL